jgi:predicted protein tyrosine phosphatase
MLTICGLEELDRHVEAPPTHVLSILDPGQPDPAFFGNFSPRARTVLRFHDAVEPLAGQVLPQRQHVEQILAFSTALGEATADGGSAHLLVHCHAGISRSSAAMTTLLAQLEPARPADAIVTQIVKLRPKAWPNLLMIEAADDLLRRDGALVAAVGRLYALQLERFPHIADFMNRSGRSREVAMGLAACGAAPGEGLGETPLSAPPRSSM